MVAWPKKISIYRQFQIYTIFNTITSNTVYMLEFHILTLKHFVPLFLISYLKLNTKKKLESLKPTKH